MKKNGIMNLPFQYMSTSSDCVPSTFTNALRALIERDSIPPLVIRMIWTYSLDYYNKRFNVVGTSLSGIELITNWLGRYEADGFRIETKMLYDHQVTQKAIEKNLDQDGVAIIEIQISRIYYHYILVISYDKERYFCFDPFLRSRNVRGVMDNVLRHNQDGYTFNISINKKWLFSWDRKKSYCLASKNERIAILLRKKG